MRLPYVSAFEEEMFEDDPFEYVRRDLLETAGGKIVSVSVSPKCVINSMERRRGNQKTIGFRLYSRANGPVRSSRNRNH